MSHSKSIVITGASSGIGEGLAKAYAKPGVYLWLIGRNPERLKQVSDLCQAQGATVSSASIDVRDAMALSRWLQEADDQAPVDLVIANAGVSAGTGNIGETEAQARNTLSTNIEGVLNTIYPLLDRMKKRKNGQIALMSSQAGFRGLPGAPSYCASKAAVRVYGEGLRNLLAEDNIHVSVICPGFVKSPMTAVNRFPMPFLVPLGQAVSIIQKGLVRKKPRISFPWPLASAVWLLTFLPLRWADYVLRQMPRKASAHT